MATVEGAPLLEGLPDATLLCDPETGEVLAANEACRELLDGAGSDPVGTDLGELGADGRTDGTAVGDALERVRGSGRDGSVGFDWRVGGGDGGDGVPVEASLGTTTRGGRDLAVVTLREAPDRDPHRDRYRALFENDQFVLWEFDLSTALSRAERVAADADDLVAYLDEHPGEHERILEGVEVLDVNGRSVEFYGADSKADLRRNLDRVTTEESLESWKRLWATLVRGDRQFRTECVARTFDGETRTVLVELTVPEACAGDCSRAYMTGLDVTERRHRRRELERKNELLEEFASVVSHDVATPLGVIENRARLVELTGDTDHAADIHEATERVRSTVERLRELARRGERVGETGPVGLDAVTREAWGSVETPAATLTVEDSTVVEAGRDRLRQLLENLLDNAVEHGSTSPRSQARGDAVEHGSTSSRSRARGNAVEHGSTSPRSRTRPELKADGGGSAGGVAVRVGVLSDGEGFYVADDGPGVPAAEREAVFERGHTTGEGGTGLGLAIVARIAEGHGWTVRVAESRDGGARFEVPTDPDG